MKANEAPKKIYIDVSLDSAWGMMERSYDNEVEYIRTDAFIDKAKNGLSSNQKLMMPMVSGAMAWKVLKTLETI